MVRVAADGLLPILDGDKTDVAAGRVRRKADLVVIASAVSLCLHQRIQLRAHLGKQNATFTKPGAIATEQRWRCKDYLK